MKILITEQQLSLLMEAQLSCYLTNYDDLVNYLGNKSERRIGNNTYVVRVNEFEIAIKLHRTNIITIDPTNVLVLNTNGWETVTTKDRLNSFLTCKRAFISSQKGVWYITGTNGTFPYEDGTEVMPDGQILLPSKI